MLAYLIYGVTAVPTCLLNHLWAYTRCHVAQFLDKTEKNNAYQFVFISLEQFLPRLKRVPGRSSLICDLFIQRLSIGKFIGNKEKHYCRHLFTINLCCLKDFWGISVRYLSVLRGHSFFFIPATTANDLRLQRIFYPRVYPLHLFSCLNSWERASIFPFECSCSAKQVYYWYHFYNVFGVTRSLTGDWTRDLPHSKPALYY